MEWVEPNSERWLSLEDLPNERWLDIAGYEGSYKISDYGRVKSLERPKTWERILKYSIKSTHYCYVGLLKNNRTKYIRVHKLVAETFISKHNYKSLNQENRSLISLNTLEVNHKDENKRNNNVDNLEWCTHLYNVNYGTRNERNCNKQSIKINQYDLTGKYIKTWNSISDIERNMHFYSSHICSCCKGIRKSANGYMWRYYNNDKNDIIQYSPKTLNQFIKGEYKWNGNMAKIENT